MGAADASLIFAAGLFAGTINTVVGSGTLATFPTLLFLGYPPVLANVSNSVGLVAGGITGSWGYRHELGGARGTLLRWAPLSLAGGVLGAVLLLVLDPAAFDAVVPVLIGLGVVLVAIGPWVTKARERRAARAPGAPDPEHPVAVGASIFGSAVYGGYFGAAQGVIMMGLLSTMTSHPLQRLNAYKNVLTTLVNLVAAVTFVVVAPEMVDWRVAGLIAAGALVGGVVGARVGRRLHPVVLRSVIVVIGVVAIVRMLWFD